MSKPAAPTPTYLPAVFPTASDRPVIISFGWPTLEAGLAAVVRAAVARSASADGAASLLGVSVTELFRVARKHGVKLPWRARPGARGGR